MEAAGIYSVVAKHNLKAYAILIISDSLVTKELTTKERESTFNSTGAIALETL
jgi:purine-nucleoside phosphorylase